MLQAVVCANCASKIASTRKRCPRCRAPIVPQDAELLLPRSRRMTRLGAALCGMSVVALGVLWMTARAAEEGGGPPPADPLAARRQIMPSSEPVDATGGPSFESVEPPYLRAARPGGTGHGAADQNDPLQRLKETVARNPRDPKALSNFAQLLVQLERPSEALTYFERACALDPDRWVHRVNLAKTLGVLERWDEAVAAYRHAQQLAPDDYLTTFHLGLALHKTRDEAAAVEAYERAIALDPSDSSVRLALGVSYEGLQKKDAAAAAYGEYLLLAPSAPDADRVRAKIAELTGNGGT